MQSVWLGNCSGQLTNSTIYWPLTQGLFIHKVKVKIDEAEKLESRGATRTRLRPHRRYDVGEPVLVL